MNCSPSFQHPPSTLIQHPSYRIPLPQTHLQGQRGQNISLNPPVAAVTQRFPLSSAYGIMHQQFLELEPRQTRDLPFNDRRVYNPHETMFRRHLTSRMRVLQEGVTILSIFLPLILNFLAVLYSPLVKKLTTRY